MHGDITYMNEAMLNVTAYEKDDIPKLKFDNCIFNNKRKFRKKRFS